MGFRTILYESLFHIVKGSGFIPDVTSCLRLNNCVSVCAHACVHVCVCVCMCVCVHAAFVISECSSVEYILYIMCPVLCMHQNCKKLII
jgi:hypothetical protein